MDGRRIAIIGAGPIGLEAALEAARRGHQVAVYDAGQVGENLRRFGWVSLFTPFRMNSTEHGRARLRETGTALPEDDALTTASDLVDRYLLPLSRLPELKGAIREGARVTQIAREGVPKSRGIVAAGDTSRLGKPFLLRVEGAGGSRFDTADVVLDASGVYATGKFTGPAGAAALGEEILGDRIERGIPALRSPAGSRFAGRSVLLLGDGHSAATVLAELDLMARENPASAPSRVHWVHRDRGAGPAGARTSVPRPGRREPVFEEIPGDPLPARSALAARANRAVRTAPWLTPFPGAGVERYDVLPGAVRATLRTPVGGTETVDVDLVLSLVGYRPDTDLYRELQVHLCYASEAPMALASALLTASLAAPARAGDCLAQISHGAEALRNPEPDFYIVGAKSYGRNASFLLTIGHQQVLDVLSLTESSGAGRSAARTSAA